jgi:hypothetical protein
MDKERRRGRLHLRYCHAIRGRQESETESETDRVAPSGCPPRAPTDPNVRNERIRFLKLSVRYAPVDRVNSPNGGIDCRPTPSLASPDVPTAARIWPRPTSA